MNGDKAKDITETVKAVFESMENKGNNTTQLVKSRFPPIWSVQKFERWKKEIERWSSNNKASEEDKYIDL